MAGLDGTLEGKGGRVRFKLSGPAGAPVVLLLNSIMADLSLWDPVAERLEGAWQVLRYDMRGHGGSSAPMGPCTLQALAEDALDLLERLNLDRVHLIGISLGGMVALRMVATDTFRLASVTLSNTGCQLSDAARVTWAQRAKQATSGGMAAIADATLERWLTADFRRQQPAKVERTRTMLLSTTPAGYAACATAIGDMDIDHLPETVRLPALVIHGRHDPAWPLEGAEGLARRLNCAELVVVEDAAHMPCIEQPDAFVAAWLAFARRQSQGDGVDRPSPLLPALDGSVPGIDPSLVEMICQERGGRLLLLYKVLLHSQPVAFGWLKLFTALRQQTRIPGRLRELVILRVATLNGAAYEFEAHAPFARAEGYSETDLNAIRQGCSPPSISVREAAALAFTDAITRHVQVPPAVFDRVRAEFDDRDLLELTVLAAGYNMVSRVLVALDIRTEH